MIADPAQHGPYKNQDKGPSQVQLSKIGMV